MAEMLSIGELSERTGVRATALRYYDQLGLVRPAGRQSGRRRYAYDAVTTVGAVLVLQDVGFSLQEITQLLGPSAGNRAEWAALVERKLSDVAEQARRLEVARTALEHIQRCPAEVPTACPRFGAVVEARVAGSDLAAADDDQHSPTT